MCVGGVLRSGGRSKTGFHMFEQMFRYFTSELFGGFVHGVVFQYRGPPGCYLFLVQFFSPCFPFPFTLLILEVLVHG